LNNVEMRADTESATQFNDFKLTIELVPSTSWYANLRKVMSQADWDTLRRQVYARYGRKCGICGATGVRLNCHEIWEYDASTHIQRLIGFVALCDLCHHVKHIGLAGLLASQGRLDYEDVVRHFMKVNGCNRKTFQAYQAWAFQQWEERSRHDWQVELGDYAGLVHRSS
jgi:hypothetical protein